MEVIFQLEICAGDLTNFERIIGIIIKDMSGYFTVHLGRHTILNQEATSVPLNFMADRLDYKPTLFYPALYPICAVKKIQMWQLGDM